MTEASSTQVQSQSRSGAASTQRASGGLPPEFLLYQLAVGHYVSRALALAVELDLADRIGDEARDLADLARATGTHAPSLLRVMRLLTATGVLVEHGGQRFGLTPMGRLLREDAPGSMKDAISLFAGVPIQDGWRELGYCVRTGQPAFKKDDPEADAFDAMRADPVFEASFDRAMAAFTAQTAVVVASIYDFGAFRRVVDVGGGTGALLIGILRANPELRGTVFDQPAVAERARLAAREAGLADRLDAVGGSFFDEVPTGADAYLIKHVIHDWNDDDATRILERCRAAMESGAKLLIVEGLYPDHVDTSIAARGATANDVNMLVSTGGRQRSEGEFRDLLARAGFDLARIASAPTGVCVIEAIPR